MPAYADSDSEVLDQTIETAVAEKYPNESPARSKAIALALKFGLTFAAVSIPLVLSDVKPGSAVTVASLMAGLSTLEFNYMEQVSKWRSSKGWLLSFGNENEAHDPRLSNVVVRFLQSNFKEYLLGFAWLFAAHLLQVNQKIETFALIAVLDSSWKALVSEGSWRLTYSNLANLLSKYFPKHKARFWAGAQKVDLLMTTAITSLNIINLNHPGSISTLLYGFGALGIAVYAGIHLLQSRPVCANLFARLSAKFQLE